MEKRKDVFIAPSMYSLFLYTLINKDWENSDFILSDRVPLVIHDSLRKNFGSYVYTYEGSKRIPNRIKRFFVFNKIYWKFCIERPKVRYERVWGNDEFAPAFKYRKQGMLLVEDGSFNSESKDFIKKIQFRNDLYYLNYWFYWVFKRYVSYGWDNMVNVIYHTNAVTLPSAIKHKGVELCLQSQWNALDNKEKSDILRLFGVTTAFMNNLDNYSTILVTQDLPIPDEDKLAIYKDMTKDLDMSKVLIKTHYAEKLDYHKYFQESEVISLPVPMQLFGLLGYKPKKVMTISSSAITPFIDKDTEVIFLGTGIDKRLEDKYGLITIETYSK